ncbi:hypothetical protein JCM10450v2_004914 [Rhodotorula kratochvilovae]
METLNERAGFLCNYEVLAVLRQQRDQRQKRIKALQQARKAAPRAEEFGTRDEIERIQPQDLHTVTFEALRYLEDPVHPTIRQTSDAVASLLDELEELDLTKAERLQIVNLAPTTAVELHICVEDMGERFDEPEQEHLLQLVRSHLGDEASATAAAKQAEADRVAAAAAAMEADGPDEIDEREAEALQDDQALIDEGYAGGRANENVERDIDEVDEA